MNLDNEHCIKDYSEVQYMHSTDFSEITKQLRGL